MWTGENKEDHRRFMYAVKKGTERVDLKEWEEDNSLWQP